MKFKHSILLLVSLFALLSCDDGIKFDNPLDEHNQTARSDTGKLGGECYRNKTCNEGLICDEENNTCIEESKNTNDDETDTASENDDDEPVLDDSDSETTPDEADSIDDFADSVPDYDSDPTDSEPDSSDSTPDEDTDTDSGDSTPDEDSDTDSGDSTPDEDSDTDSGDSTPDQDADTDTTPTNPCNPNPCNGITNSTGSCTVSGTSYSCVCVEGTVEKDGKCQPKTQTCPTGFSCSNGYCAKKSDPAFFCAENSDCGASMTCTSPSLPSGQCHGCSDTTPCPGADEEGSIVSCLAGYCMRGCLIDDDCSVGMVCKTSGYCGKKDCSKPSDCPTNYTCKPTSDSSTTGTCSRIPCESIVECSTTSGTPCKDSSTTYIWSQRYGTMTWQAAIDHCTSLNSSNYGGYSSGWHLPNISELRTLIQNCSKTQMPNGSCGVIDTGNSSTSCLSYNSCWTSNTCASCSYDSTGGHSKFGEIGGFWSSSIRSDNSGYAWYVYFNDGAVSNINEISDSANVRCVRK